MQIPLHCLHGGAERERNSKSRFAFQATAHSSSLLTADTCQQWRRSLWIDLEFEFLSRIIASMQSMRRSPQAAAVTLLPPPSSSSPAAGTATTAG